MVGVPLELPEGEAEGVFVEKRLPLGGMLGVEISLPDVP